MISHRFKLIVTLFIVMSLLSFSGCNNHNDERQDEVEILAEQIEEIITEIIEERVIKIGYDPLTEEEILANLAEHFPERAFEIIGMEEEQRFPEDFAHDFMDENDEAISLIEDENERLYYLHRTHVIKCLYTGFSFSIHSGGSRSLYRKPSDIYVSYGLDRAIRNEDDAENGIYITFMTTQRLHIDMPEFTFYRIVGETFSQLEHARLVTIRIELEGQVLQEIEGLSQYVYPSSRRWVAEGRFGDEQFEIRFADFTSNGYLGMMLVNSLGGSMENTPSYFWLWDVEMEQFVENEFLNNMSATSTIWIDEEGRVVSHVRGAPGEYGRMLYEYTNGVFVHVMSEVSRYDAELGCISLTSTDVMTGIETVSCLY